MIMVRMQVSLESLIEAIAPLDVEVKRKLMEIIEEQIFEAEEESIISIGGMLDLTVKAAEKLTMQGYSIEVLSMPTLYPLDEQSILQSAEKTKKIITLEEHGIGGLGSAVAEVLAQSGETVEFKPLRLKREAVKTAGSQTVLRSQQGLDLDGIVQSALAMLRGVY